MLLGERNGAFREVGGRTHVSGPVAEVAGEALARVDGRRFRGRAPLALMLEDGVNGLCRVRAELDCSFSWNRSQEPGA